MYLTTPLPCSVSFPFRFCPTARSCVLPLYLSLVGTGSSCTLTKWRHWRARCKGSSALGHEIGHFRSFQSPRSCHASPLISDIATNSLVFPHASISPRIYALFIPPSISQFAVPCLVVFSFLPPSSDAPHCSSHSDFRVTTFQDRPAVPNCDTNGLKPLFLASCFLHHLSTIRSFYRFHCVLLTPLVFRLGRSTSCLS